MVERRVALRSADEVAISILTWLAGEPELLGRFLALTGTDPAGLRRAASDPAFLAGLVAFLMNHEPTLMAFSNATGVAPSHVVAAHDHFEGPAPTDDT